MRCAHEIAGGSAGRRSRIEAFEGHGLRFRGGQGHGLVVRLQAPRVAEAAAVRPPLQVLLRDLPQVAGHVRHPRVRPLLQVRHALQELSVCPLGRGQARLGRRQQLVELLVRRRGRGALLQLVHPLVLGRLQRRHALVHDLAPRLAARAPVGARGVRGRREHVDGQQPVLRGAGRQGERPGVGDDAAAERRGVLLQRHHRRAPAAGEREGLEVLRADAAAVERPGPDADGEPGEGAGRGAEGPDLPPVLLADLEGRAERRRDVEVAAGQQVPGDHATVVAQGVDDPLVLPDEVHHHLREDPRDLGEGGRAAVVRVDQPLELVDADVHQRAHDAVREVVAGVVAQGGVPAEVRAAALRRGCAGAAGVDGLPRGQAR